MTGDPSPQEQQAILRQRATRLARMAKSHERPAGIELMYFVLGDAGNAIESRFVREVLPNPDVTAIPGVPRFVRGVTNLRGEILTVVDLATFLGEGRPVTGGGVLVLEVQGATMLGIAADSIDEVRRVESASLLDVPQSSAESARTFLQGVLADGTTVLDGAALLHDERLFLK